MAPRAGGLTRVVLAGLVAAAITNCDLVTDPGTGQNILVVYTADTTLIVGTTISPAIRVSIDGAAATAPRLRLESSDNGVVVITPGGDSLRVVGRGRATVRATLIDPTLAQNPPFADQPVRAVADRVQLDSAAVTFRSLGDTASIPGSPLDATGAVIPNAPLTWQSADETIATVDATGRITSKNNGTTTVRAIVDDDTATVGVTVAQVLTNFRFDRSIVELAAIGATVTIVVTPLDARDSVIRGAGIPTATWISLDPAVATVSAAGAVTALANGSTRLTASSGTVVDTLPVTVRQVAKAIVISVPPPFAADTVRLRSIQDSIRLTVLATDSLGTSVLNATPTWRSLDPAVVQVGGQDGIVRALGLGTGRVVAQLDQPADTIPVVVTNEAASVTISPDTAVITSLGATRQLTATVRNGLRALLPTVPVTWSSLDSAIAIVDQTGVARAISEGTVDVIASVSPTVSATSVVVVRDLPDTVVIIPAVDTLTSVGDAVTPPVNFKNATGLALPRSSVTWSTSNGAVAAVDQGVITATGKGDAIIRAVNPFNSARRDSITITVTNAPAALALNRTSDVLPSLNRTLTYDATVTNARGGFVPETDWPVVWSTRPAGIASVTQTGVATAIGIGTTYVIATSGTVIDSAELIVSNNASSVSISPSLVAFTSIGETRQLVLTVLNELGNPILNPTANWAVTSGGSVVTVSGTGFLTAVGTGSATVSATVDGVTASIPVTVTSEPTVVQFTSADTTLASVGDSYSPGITLQDALGATLARQTVDWRTSNINVATVSAAGLVTATGAGVAQISATSPFDQTITDAIAVTVTNAPVTIVLNRSRDTLTALGRTLLYSAEVRNAAANLIPNAAVTWNSTRMAIATINASGTATAAGVDTTLIVGTATNGIADTAVLVVTNNAVSITVTPARDTILDLGTTAQLTAVALNDLGNSVGSAAIAWNHLDAAIGTVNGSGLVTASAVNTGLARIVASTNAGTLADTSFITVANAPRTLTLVAGPIVLASVGDSAFPLATLLNLGGAALSGSAATWSTTAPNVASVSDTGAVVALAKGTATIRATSPFDPSLTATVQVQVTNAPVGVQLNRTNDTLTAIGRTLDYTAVVVNQAGNPIPGETVTWSSLAPAATITPGGGIATAAQVGVSTIRATVVSTPAITGDATLTVQNNAASVTFNPTSLSLTALTQQKALTATPRNDLGNAIPGLAISWSSTDPAIVAPPAGGVQAGTVTAAGVGTATVTAAAVVGAGPDTVFASIVIPVTNDPTAINLTPDFPAGGPPADSVQLTSLGDTISPVIAIQNVLGNAITDRSAVTWSSTNSSVASVSTTGLITAIDTGFANIRAVSPADGTVRDSVRVHVFNTPASVSINAVGAPDTLTAIGQTITYTATVFNARGNPIPNAPVTWNSDRPTEVDASGGTITALAFTTADASVTASSGPATSPAVTVVVRNPTALHVNKDVAATVRLGTIKRPFASIQNAANAANPGDTIFVARTATPYTEPVTLAASVLIQGTNIGGAGCTATGCTTPSQLPTVRHASGAAAITAATNTTVRIRHLAVEHQVDGPALDADGAKIDLEFFYVNPTAPLTPTGRGINIRNVTVGDSARIRRSAIRHVRGYGIRLENVTGMRIDSIEVTNVASVAGVDIGAALVVIGGSADSVYHNRFTRNNVGVRLSAVGTLVLDTNDIFENDSLGGATFPDNAALFNNWWGDGRGPRRDLNDPNFNTAADSAATGDSVAFAVTPSAGVYATVRAAPTFAGTVADTLISIRGDNQVTTTDSVAFFMTVRVADAQGLPVPGVDVVFDITNNCDMTGGTNADDINPISLGEQCSVTVLSSASGLADAMIDFGNDTNVRTVTVSVTGVANTVTFLVERQ